MNILVLNGPNINMLGIREPDIYGSDNYDALCRRVSSHADRKGIDCRILQSNHEGDLVDMIQQAFFDKVDGLVFNPGAYTHTSIAIADALKAVRIPTVEVHISDVSSRESFRQISYIRESCIATVSGKGIDGYLEAIDILCNHIEGR
ncbi:MAG: 3-dehydroquinate dehydratase [Bacteroidaceae bacterium]|nr:3-dehydroquinate dehydratase [Bacteroidaceae bacterium]